MRRDFSASGKWAGLLIYMIDTRKPFLYGKGNECVLLDISFKKLYILYINIETFLHETHFQCLQNRILNVDFLNDWNAVPPSGLKYNRSA